MTEETGQKWYNPDDHEIEAIIRDIETVAIVGLSSNPERPSNEVGKYLISQGFRVIPVNPQELEILGQKSYPDLQAIKENIDVVDIFRKGEATPPIAMEAIKIGARYIWLQKGVVSQESFDIAKSAGVPIVMDRCLREEHERLRSKDGTA